MNLLTNETSPYLLQHAENPVDWMPWGEDAIQKARELNKPILLSIGYSSCHWCHVMAHESFEDPETAALMNMHFINIKVDREERPDIDAIYQSALSLTGQQGGWPLTMFLSPDLKPFWGGTYFPPQPRHGLPSFRQILSGVADSFAHESQKVSFNGEALLRAIGDFHALKGGRIPDARMLDQVAEALGRNIDPAHGGFGTAPKFPSLPTLRFLWESFIRTGAEKYKFAIVFSLTHMCQGGIYDHIGGGFHRYAVDRAWLVPHFEKMLYDQALFIGLLSDVYALTKNPLFADRVAETIGFVLNDMSVSNDFITSINADDDKGEGAFYVWSEDEINNCLGADSTLFKNAYGVTKSGNWEGVNILNRLNNTAPDNADDTAMLSLCRAKLREKRAQRQHPGKDTKVLTDLNGMMICALAKAAVVFDKPEWLSAAEQTYQRSYRAALTHTAAIPAFLDDYAFMISAAIALHETTGKEDYLTQAQSMAVHAITLFHDDKEGGFYTAQNLPDSPLRLKILQDLPHPSGNSIMIDNLVKLFLLTQNEQAQSIAENTAAVFAGDIDKHYFSRCTYLISADTLMNPITVKIPRGNQDYLNALSSLHSAHLTIIHDDGLDNKAFVCQGRRCLPAVYSPEELTALIQSLRLHTAANDG